MRRLVIFIAILCIISANILILNSDNLFYKKSGIKEKSGLLKKMEAGLRKDLTVKITSPAANAAVEKSITIEGTAEKKVDYVEVRIDEGDWVRAAGTDTWSAILEAPSFGEHVITARSHSKYKIVMKDSIKVAVTWQLEKPMGVAASDGTYTNKIAVQWKSMANAKEYHLYYSTFTDKDYALLTKVSTTNYDDGHASAGKKIYYKVLASATGLIKSEMSVADDGYMKLWVPIGVVASDDTYTDKIRIKWNAVDGADKYYIYRANSSNGTYTDLGNVTGTTYDDTTAVAGTTYYYKVKANATTGDSEFSKYDSGLRKYFQPHMIPEMISIPAVTSFSMGGPTNEGGSTNERPIHPVNLNAFNIGKYEVTIQQYVYFLNSGGKDLNYHIGMTNDKYCGIIKNNPGNYSIISGRETYPISCIHWSNAEAYCDWLSQETGKTYRLPTEAEWEYAAVGTNGHITYPWVNTFYTNYCNNGYDGPAGSSDGNKDGYIYTAPVGSYENGKSPFGLYDMMGNIWEWCSDWYDTNYYSSSPINNPTGPITGDKRVERGGSWNNGITHIRCALRGYHPGAHGTDMGVRVARTD